MVAVCKMPPPFQLKTTFVPEGVIVITGLGPNVVNAKAMSMVWPTYGCPGG